MARWPTKRLLTLGIFTTIYETSGSMKKQHREGRTWIRRHGHDIYRGCGRFSVRVRVHVQHVTVLRCGMLVLVVPCATRCRLCWVMRDRRGAVASWAICVSPCGGDSRRPVDSDTAAAGLNACQVWLCANERMGEMHVRIDWLTAMSEHERQLRVG